MIDAVRLRRRQRAVAARLLLQLYADDKLDAPHTWTWSAVDLLPAWCLASATDRRYLQLICGALILSPEIRFWIQKPLLQALRQLLGDEVLQQIIDHADQMKLPREPLAEFFEEASFSLERAGLSDVESLLMQSGATVLQATVHESLPRDMLTESLGVSIGDINESAAAAILEIGSVLMHKGMTTADAV